MAAQDAQILVVDDDEAIKLNLIAFLSDYGYRVWGVPSGECALALLQREECQLCVVDIRLSGMDGETFILKSHQLYPTLKYIIHTGSTEYSVSDELISAGVTTKNLIFKPLSDMMGLEQMIKSLLKSY